MVVVDNMFTRAHEARRDGGPYERPDHCGTGVHWREHGARSSYRGEGDDHRFLSRTCLSLLLAAIELTSCRRDPSERLQRLRLDPDLVRRLNRLEQPTHRR